MDNGALYEGLLCICWSKAVGDQRQLGERDWGISLDAEA
jgi:hypothetical protein